MPLPENTDYVAPITDLSDGVPNFDAMFPDDLRIFAKEAVTNMETVAMEMFSGAIGVSANEKHIITLKLSGYARLMAESHDYRTSGKVALANESEAEADEIYKQLPRWAMW